MGSVLRASRLGTMRGVVGALIASGLCAPWAASAPVLYEGFDVATGPLHGKAGATSFGFDAVLGTFWDKSIFDDPEVGAGSIAAPGSTAGFYTAVPVGNRVIQDFQGTTVTRTTAVSAPHLYGTFLATLSLNPAVGTPRASVLYTNFSVFGETTGGPTTWHVQTAAGVTNTGIDANTTTLVSWELVFDQVNSSNPDTLRVWFNTNPLSAPADFQITSANLGQNLLGGLTLRNDIFLGISTVEFDEFRIGTDWQSVGIQPAPPVCPGDIDNSGGVDVDDLNAILSAFGGPVPPGDPRDLANNDGLIDVDDLNVVLANFGCP
ncbi:MAG: hypothetical protein H6812_03980 [Phycisphaeraceae bacterium]|nr:hypothetical protein [Phycisphaeraceae bacterium]